MKIFLDILISALALSCMAAEIQWSRGRMQILNDGPDRHTGRLFPV